MNSQVISHVGQSAMLWVTEGEEPTGGWSSLYQVPVLHYDFTSSCQLEHSHVAWSATSKELQVAINAAMRLVQPLLRPESDAYRNARLEALSREVEAIKRETGFGIVPDVHPDTWTCTAVLAAVMWAAGCQGRGPADAIGWLSAGQLKGIRDYCISRARSIGKDNIPLWGNLDAALASPDLPYVVSVVWQALAPFEEVIRRSSFARPGLQMLDVDHWLATSNLLIVTLPAQPTALQVVIPSAIFFAVSGPGGSAPRLEAVWQQVGGELVKWRFPLEDVRHAASRQGGDAGSSS